MREMKQGEGTAEMSRKETMQRVRRQVLLIRKLSGQMRELSRDGLRSMHMDGMLRASGPAQKLDAKMLRQKALVGMLQRESPRPWEIRNELLFQDECIEKITDHRKDGKRHRCTRDSKQQHSAIIPC